MTNDYQNTEKDYQNIGNDSLFFKFAGYLLSFSAFAGLRITGLLCVYPLSWRHARDGFEVAEKGGFGAEARLSSYGSNLGFVFQKLFLGMTYAACIDKLRERLASHTVDALTDITAVDVKEHRHVLQPQVSTQVELLAFHEQVDTAHQLFCLAIAEIFGF